MGLLLVRCRMRVRVRMVRLLDVSDCMIGYGRDDEPLVPCEPVTREMAASASWRTSASGFAFNAGASTFCASAGRASERYT